MVKKLSTVDEIEKVHVLLTRSSYSWFGFFIEVSRASSTVILCWSFPVSLAVNSPTVVVKTLGVWWPSQVDGVHGVDENKEQCSHVFEISNTEEPVSWTYCEVYTCQRWSFQQLPVFITRSFLVRKQWNSLCRCVNASGQEILLLQECAVNSARDLWRLPFDITFLVPVVSSACWCAVLPNLIQKACGIL